MKEFELIEQIKKKCEKNYSEVICGIGDDCAVLPFDEKYFQIISTDSLVEDIHFSRKYFSSKDIGWKALAVNLSDIAAMGGIPKFVTISLGLSSIDWVPDFYDGLLSLSHKFDVEVVGGNMSRSEKNWISLTISGLVEKDKIKYRQCFSTDQFKRSSIWITGNLGYSHLGFHKLKLNHNDSSFFSKSHLRPNPQINEGIYLSNQAEVLSMMDISDGLYSDLKKLCGNGHFRLDFSNYILSSRFKEECRILALDPIKVILEGGEDYELLFLVDYESEDFFKEKIKKDGFQFIRIGDISEYSEDEIIGFDGDILKNQFLGYDHFGNNK